LSLERTRLVVLDLSRDVKGYHMLKLRDTAADTCRLFQRHLMNPAVQLDSVLAWSRVTYDHF
jgi:hypothetical protein